MVAIVKRIEAHPEFVLSRREIIKYVLAPPGKRAEEVQSLLHLDNIETVRVRLQRVANACDRTVRDLKSATADANKQLKKALDVAELTKDGVLIEVNKRRSVLDLVPLEGFSESISFKDGADTPGTAPVTGIRKAPAQSELDTARERMDELADSELSSQIEKTVLVVQELMKDPWSATGLTREDFFKMKGEIYNR